MSCNGTGVRQHNQEDFVLQKIGKGNTKHLSDTVPNNQQTKNDGLIFSIGDISSADNV